MCVTSFLKEDFVLILPARNCHDHWCVTVTRRCTTTMLTTRTFDRHNERTVGSDKKYSMFDNSVAVGDL